MVRDIRNVLKDKNGTTLFKYFKTKLSRIRIEVFGIFQTVVLKVIQYLNIKEVSTANIPDTPADGEGGVVYVKTSDGKPYYKSNEIAETSLLSSESKFTYQGNLTAATANTTNIYTYDVDGFNKSASATISLASGSIGDSSITIGEAHQIKGLYVPYNLLHIQIFGIATNASASGNNLQLHLYKSTPSLSSSTDATLTLIATESVALTTANQAYSFSTSKNQTVSANQLLYLFLVNPGHDGGTENIYVTYYLTADISV